MPLAVPWGLCSRDRGANDCWIRAPQWKQEQKHLSSATQRLRGPKALLVRLPSYISGGCCIIETLKSLWFPHEWSSGVTWRALSCTWKQKEPASLLREEKKKKTSLKVRSMDRWALSSRTAPGCLPTEGNQTAEVEFVVIREEEDILWAITLLRYCLNHMTRERSHDGVWRNLKRRHWEIIWM